MSDLSAYAAVLAGALATYKWRGLGVLLARRIDPHSRLFDWVGCVAYALIAGLVARMVLLPVGPLQATAAGSRVLAALLAVAAYFLLRRNLLIAVGIGAVALSILSGLGF